MFKISLCVALLLLFNYSCADDLVPLLAWSNSDSLSSAQSQSNLKDIFGNVKISDFKLAVVLKSSALSFDDIAKYGGVYGEKNAPLSSLQEYLSDASSSLSTGVSGPSASDLVFKLSFDMETAAIYIQDLFFFPELIGNDPHLVVMEMPEGDDEETFKAHDSIIRQTQSILEKTKLPYVVFYTADSPSHPTYQFSPHLARRSAPSIFLGAEGESTEKVCYSVEDYKNNENCTSTNSTNNPCPSCLLMCVNTEMRFVEYNQTMQDILIDARTNNSEDIFFNGGECDVEGSADFFPDLDGVHFTYMSLYVEPQYNDSSTPDLTTANKTLYFAFLKNPSPCSKNSTLEKQNITDVDCGFWTMRVYVGPGNITNDNTSALELYTQYHSERIFTRMSIPLNSDLNHTNSHSYACGNSSLNRFVKMEVVTNSTKNSSSIRNYVQLTGLQVQPFAVLKPSGTPLQFYFGTAYNCQGYLGTTSWMGVVSVLILLLILYISTVFIFSIQTIDRFDDPRGETIKVENLH